MLSYTHKRNTKGGSMTENIELMTVDNICTRVYTIRGQQVMLDADLAEIYGYEVKRLNEQVKRNKNRFPDDFMFQLKKEELQSVWSQNATANINSMSRSIPYAFTEQGIYMLATVLRGELAEQQSIFIMRAFREMRHYIQQNHQFVTQTEMNLINAKVSSLTAQIAGITDKQKKTENEVGDIQKKIDVINENFVTEKDYKNFLIYKGEKFEADVAYVDIYQRAAKSIYVVDDYMNTKTLQLLSQKKKDVEVVLFTQNGHGKKGFLTKAIVTDFQNQYPTLRIKSNEECHDRLIVLDYGLDTEQAYHCGASSKDAGKKLCAINKLSDTTMVHPVIDKLLLGSEILW